MKNVFGDPPAWFDKEKCAIRKELIAEAPPDLWLSIDRWGVEVLVTLIARCRSSDANTSDFRQLLSMLEKFGLTPRSRARIAAVNARRERKRRPS